jgi:hypothetical protein
VKLRPTGHRGRKGVKLVMSHKIVTVPNKRAREKEDKAEKPAWKDDLQGSRKVCMGPAALGALQLSRQFLKKDPASRRRQRSQLPTV